jgi:hypothetical protein
VRNNTYVTCKCQHFQKSEFSSMQGPDGKSKPAIARTVGLKLVCDKTVTYSMDVAALASPIWRAARTQAPAGQPVVIVGTVGTSQRCGPWNVARIEGELPGKPQPQVTSQPVPAAEADPGSPPKLPTGLPAASPTPSNAKTSPALLLCGGWFFDSIPEGWFAVGGLLVGKWTAPDGTATMPVVLVVVAAGR